MAGEFNVGDSVYFDGKRGTLIGRYTPEKADVSRWNIPAGWDSECWWIRFDEGGDEDLRLAPPEALRPATPPACPRVEVEGAKEARVAGLKAAEHLESARRAADAAVRCDAEEALSHRALALYLCAAQQLLRAADNHARHVEVRATACGYVRRAEQIAWASVTGPRKAGGGLRIEAPQSEPRSPTPGSPGTPWSPTSDAGVAFLQIARKASDASADPPDTMEESRLMDGDLSPAAAAALRCLFTPSHAPRLLWAERAEHLRPPEGSSSPRFRAGTRTAVLTGEALYVARRDQIVRCVLVTDITGLDLCADGWLAVHTRLEHSLALRAAPPPPSTALRASQRLCGLLARLAQLPLPQHPLPRTLRSEGLQLARPQGWRQPPAAPILLHPRAIPLEEPPASVCHRLATDASLLPPEDVVGRQEALLEISRILGKEAGAAPQRVSAFAS
eukprot:Hpha_TRINITY_DN11879_c0_g1::TRINITY_DN11879_c0_g1_i1::g.2042::m.2042